MSERSTGDQRIGLTRRRLVRETAVVGATAVPILAGTATAQTDAEGQSTDTDDEDRETALTAALPADALRSFVDTCDGEGSSVRTSVRIQIARDSVSMVTYGCDNGYTRREYVDASACEVETTA